MQLNRFPAVFNHAADLSDDAAGQHGRLRLLAGRQCVADRHPLHRQAEAVQANEADVFGIGLHQTAGEDRARFIRRNGEDDAADRFTQPVLGQGRHKAAAYVLDIRKISGIQAHHRRFASFGVDQRLLGIFRLDGDLAVHLAQQLRQELGGQQGAAVFRDDGGGQGLNAHFAVGAGQLHAFFRRLNEHALIYILWGSLGQRPGHQIQAVIDVV